MTRVDVTVPAPGGTATVRDDAAPDPDAPVVLALHGALGRPRHWDGVAAALSGRTRVVAVHRSTPASLTDEAERTRALLGALGADRAVAVGHSMGGFVAEALARLAPDAVAGLVLLDGSVAAPPGPGIRAEDAACRAAGSACDALVAAARWSRGSLPVTGAAAGLVAPVRAALRAGAGALSPLAADLHESGEYHRWAVELLALRTRRPLPPIRIEVVTALRRARTPGRAAWLADQRGLVDTLAGDHDGPPAPRVGHRVVCPAPHAFLQTHPREIAEAIVSVLTESRA